MKKIPFIALLMLATLFVFAQKKNESKPSPLAMSTYKYKDTYIKITYSTPSKKERDIFGALVPYGKVWRTGANEATEITFTREVKIAGQMLPAGTYSLFTIPNERKWAVIFNSELGLWGAYKYDESKNVMEATAIVSAAEETEVFKISLDPKDNIVNLSFTWDKVRVALPISLFEPLNESIKSMD